MSVTFAKPSDIVPAAQLRAAVDKGWTITRTTDNVVTLERDARAYENGITVDQTHNWVHFYADGTVQVYERTAYPANDWGIYRQPASHAGHVWGALILTNQHHHHIDY